MPSYRIIQGSGIGRRFEGSLHGAKLAATRGQRDVRVPVAIHEEVTVMDVLNRIGELIALLRDLRAGGSSKWRPLAIKRADGRWRELPRE